MGSSGAGSWEGQHWPVLHGQGHRQRMEGHRRVMGDESNVGEHIRDVMRHGGIWG